MRDGQYYREKVREGLSEGRFKSVDEVFGFLANDVVDVVNQEIDLGEITDEEQVATSVFVYTVYATDVFPEDAQFKACARIINLIDMEALYSRVSAQAEISSEIMSAAV